MTQREVISKRSFDFTGLTAAATQRLVLAQGIDARGMNEGTLVVRVHERSVAGGSTGAIVVRVRPDARTAEDPSALFSGPAYVELTAADAVSTAPFHVPAGFWPSAETLLVEVEGRQDAINGNQALSASLSVDLVLRRRPGVQAIRGFRCVSTSDHYVMASTSGGPQGSASMTVCMIVSVGQQPASNQWMVERDTGTGGFQMICSTAGMLRFRIRDGAGTLRDSNGITPRWGKLDILWGRYGSGNLDLRVNATDASAVTGLSGYTAPGTSAMGIGIRDGATNPAGDVDVYGVCFADSVRLSDAELEQHRLAILGAGRMVPFPQGTSFLWTGDGAYRLDASWAALVGSAAFTRTGSPTPRSAAFNWGS